MKFLTVLIITFTLTTNVFADDSTKYECPAIYADPLGYVGCQVVGTTLLPFVLITAVGASVVGTSATTAGATRHKAALLSEAAPYAANYLISPESEENNPVLMAAFQVVADDPNAEVVPSPELAQRILDAVKAE